MKRTFLLILLILNLLNGFGQDSMIDSTIVMTDSATINGEKYKAIYRTDEFLYILDSKDNVVFKSKDYYPNFEFVDFDNDGYKELIIYRMFLQ